MAADRSRALSWIASYFVFIGVVIILFWVLFFTTDWLHLSDWECYYVFERSFPLADAWLALCCFAAAVGLRRERSYGLLFGLLACGAVIFLALMDLLYSLQNDVFWPFTMDSVVELAIVTLLLIPATRIIPWLWQHRTQFLAGDA